ncbi:unnamed protein product [Withania somnifera]
MTVKKGTSRVSCAACKYQRRKCTPQCVLASYFPANQPKKFQNVHRLFGVRNVVKILEQLEDEDQKADAMKSKLQYVHAQLHIYRQQNSSETSFGNGMVMLPFFSSTQGSTYPD